MDYIDPEPYARSGHGSREPSAVNEDGERDDGGLSVSSTLSESVVSKSSVDGMSPTSVTSNAAASSSVISAQRVEAGTPDVPDIDVAGLEADRQVI